MVRIIDPRPVNPAVGPIGIPDIGIEQGRDLRQVLEHIKTPGEVERTTSGLVDAQKFRFQGTGMAGGEQDREIPGDRGRGGAPV